MNGVITPTSSGSLWQRYMHAGRVGFRMRRAASQGTRSIV